MIELGHFACMLALCLALAQSMLAWRSQITLPVMQRLLLSECCCLLFACVSLWAAFLLHDFSVAVVYAHSHHHLPWWYRLTALWGGHEGSVLFWVTLLAGWRLAFSRYATFLDQDKKNILGVLALIGLGITAFLLFSSNPFTRLLPLAPLEGKDLNPLLQDPGMASHPPILYFGYVAFAIPYACMCVMLWRGKVIDNWAQKLRPWVLLAWSALTCGIVLGSWWAYRELGWGGWWFWDPVENASLLPWLGGALLIHGLALVQKQGSAQLWTAMVAILGFILSLLGTFLVRSGVLISVHSFAEDPHRGIWILTLIGIYAGPALLLFVTRAQGLFHSKATPLEVTPFEAMPLLSRGGAILANQLILGVMLLTVLLGTLYPMALEVLGLGKISVGAPYFNQVMPWLCIPMLLFLAILPYLNWHSTRYTLTCHDILKIMACFLISASVAWCFVGIRDHQVAWIILGVSFCALGSTVFECYQLWRRDHLTLSKKAMCLAHASFLCLIISIAISSALSVSRMVVLHPDKPYELSQHRFTYLGSESIQGPNYRGVRAKIKIKTKDHVWRAYPELRHYEPSQMNLAKTAILPRPTYDIYLALGEPLKTPQATKKYQKQTISQTSWTMRIQIKPMVRGIWLSGLGMALAGLMAWFARRRKT